MGSFFFFNGPPSLRQGLFFERDVSGGIREIFLVCQGVLVHFEAYGVDVDDFTIRTETLNGGEGKEVPYGSSAMWATINTEMEYVNIDAWLSAQGGNQHMIDAAGSPEPAVFIPVTEQRPKTSSKVL